MGKYTKVVPRLRRPQVAGGPPPTEEGDARQAKVEEHKRVWLLDNPDPDTATLVRAYVELRGARDYAKSELSKANLELEAVQQLMIAAYESTGTRSMATVGGDTVRIDIEPHAVVKDKQAFHKWCLANGFADQMQLPWSTTNSVTKERLLNDESEPDGVEAWLRRKPVLTKAKRAS